MTYNNLHVPRERDNEILLMLRLRTLGRSPRAIGERLGERLGERPQNVRITTNTIKSADLHESGEADAEAGYWA